MSIEAWKLKDKEQKDSIINQEENQKKQLKKALEHKKVKEKISVEIESEKQILNLKELVDKWVISNETKEKIDNWIDIWEDVVNFIFEKIDEIENVNEIDKYLPKELRISHDEYIRALHDDIFRVQTITKLNSALTLLYNQINPNSVTWLSIFSWYLLVLDKNLIKIQENTIDIKYNLKKIDDEKFWNINKKISFWRKIINFLKEIFS